MGKCRAKCNGCTIVWREIRFKCTMKVVDNNYTWLIGWLIINNCELFLIKDYCIINCRIPTLWSISSFSLTFCGLGLWSVMPWPYHTVISSHERPSAGRHALNEHMLWSLVHLPIIATWLNWLTVLVTQTSGLTKYIYPQNSLYLALSFNVVFWTLCMASFMKYFRKIAVMLTILDAMCSDKRNKMNDIWHWPNTFSDQHYKSLYDRTS